MEKKSNIVLSNFQQTALAQFTVFSLKILEMNNVTLQEIINNSLNENPFLKENEEDDFPKISPDFTENIVDILSHRDIFFRNLSFLKLNIQEKEIAEILYDYLIENKYISNDFCRIISKEKNISYQNILNIINKLRKISPHGLFSFNLQDKIKNIFEASNKYDTSHKIFIRYIDTLLYQGIEAFRKKTNLDKDTIHSIFSDLKNIDYYSRNSENYFDNIYRKVDIILEKKNKTYNSEINNLKIPSIDRELLELSTKKAKSYQDKKYIKEKKADAELLIKSINYRNSTLLKIIQEIIHRQSDFFNENTSFLVPISVRSIANSMMCHQSTVHRAIMNKTISTPLGIFNIKDLMPKEIKSDKNKCVITDHSIKKYIQALINNEPKNSPYSDSEIAYLLEERGINMPRRTIAKYRNDMDIANCNDRLKEYSLINI